MSPRLRQAGLPLVALALVSAVLGVQLGYGGWTYEPLRPADPCAARTVTSESDGIEGLTERLVLIGVDDAACTLGVSREEFTLDLATAGTPTDAEVDALHDGLLSAVDQMAADGSLPPASALVDDALEQADLDSLLETLIRALPDSVVDEALSTEDVLTRTIDDLDLRALLTNLDDPDELDAEIEPAVTQAVKDSLADRLRDLL